jgi:hypothetical protein
MHTVNNTLRWVKSSYSGASGTSCVEVADLPKGGRVVRDSKNPDAGHLELSRNVWQAFIAEIKAGHLS